jgi:Xaa-Pro aminopeptidase
MLVSNELDAVLVTSYPALYYLTGVPLHQYGRPAAAVMVRGGPSAIITSIIEKTHVDAQSWVEDRRHYLDYGLTGSFADPITPPESLVSLVGEIVLDRGLAAGRIGYEEWDLPAGRLADLTARLPGVKFIPMSEAIARLRVRLSDEELHWLRRADAIADAGLEALIANYQHGRTAPELDEIARGAMVGEALRDGTGAPFAIYAGIGLGSARKGAGHSEWVTWDATDRVVAGRQVLLDCRATVWGYYGNVERTILVGDVPDSMDQPYSVMLDANAAGLAATRPGVTLREIDLACKTVLLGHGYTTRTGSGLGRGITSYEGDARELLMDVRPYNELVLEPGMAYELAPDVLHQHLGLFLHATTVIITETGYELDSRLPLSVIRV